MTTRIARRRRFAVLGLVCAALALACLAVISLPPAFETTITKATPESGYAWVASLPKTFPNRFLYKVSNGDADAVSPKDMLLTEDGRRLLHIWAAIPTGVAGFTLPLRTTATPIRMAGNIF